MKLHDVVRLTEDLAEHGLRRGAVGTVVFVHDEAEGIYEVEFADDRGRTITEIALGREQLERLTPSRD